MRNSNICQFAKIRVLEDSIRISNDPLSLYADFTIKLSNFQMQYGMTLFHSWSRAIKSASNLQELTGKKIQDEIRTTFDKELKNALQKKDFSKSLSDFIDSSTEIASTIHHDKLYRYLEAMTNNYDHMIEPIRDTINRTPSEIIPMKGNFGFIITKHLHRQNSKPLFLL